MWSKVIAFYDISTFTHLVTTVLCRHAYLQRKESVPRATVCQIPTAERQNCLVPKKVGSVQSHPTTRHTVNICPKARGPEGNSAHASVLDFLEMTPMKSQTKRLRMTTTRIRRTKISKRVKVELQDLISSFCCKTGWPVTTQYTSHPFSDRASGVESTELPRFASRIQRCYTERKIIALHARRVYATRCVRNLQESSLQEHASSFRLEWAYILCRLKCRDLPMDLGTWLTEMSGFPYGPWQMTAQSTPRCITSYLYKYCARISRMISSMWRREADAFFDVAKRSWCFLEMDSSGNKMPQPRLSMYSTVFKVIDICFFILNIICKHSEIDSNYVGSQSRTFQQNDILCWTYTNDLLIYLGWDQNLKTAA